MRLIPLPQDSVRGQRRVAATRSYGDRTTSVQRFARVLVAMIACAAGGYFHGSAVAAPKPDQPVAIVALGDSLTAGLGLVANEAFPAKLERALAAKGIAATIANAGVSGDTAAGGLTRLDWSVPDGTEAVIVELGANDALRGTDPKVTRGALDAILRRLKERKIPVLLYGMLAPPNMGEDYARAFNSIFPELAAAYETVFYPFFLDGVAADRKLNQRDGIHPTAAGVDLIIARSLPKVEELIARAKAKRGS